MMDCSFSSVVFIAFVLGITFSLLLIFVEYSDTVLGFTIGCFAVGIFLYVFEWWLFRPNKAQQKIGDVKE